jgi:sarcosine oxidase
MQRFETIVIGLGATGSAAVCQLARRGNAVLGIDQFEPPHDRGSTHGDTRITRLAIGEGEQYTPFALRSHHLWRELEGETGTRLLTTNGCLVISSGATAAQMHVENFFANTLAAARRYGIAHEILNAGQIRSRFPHFRVSDDEMGYLERDGGFLCPEACVRAQLAVARRLGATIHTQETATRLAATSRGVTVTTDRGSYGADKLIVAAGPWLPSLIDARLARHFKVYRQVMFWFDVEGPVDAFRPASLPVFIWELKGRKHGIYGSPAVAGPGGGVKIATEQFDGTTGPDAPMQPVSDEEKCLMYEGYVAPYFSGISGRCVKALTCLYTVTPDFAFVIDVHPDSERVILASPCSGHGFKHSPAVGEALSELVVDGATRLDLGAFSMHRLLLRGSRGGATE